MPRNLEQLRRSAKLSVGQLAAVDAEVADEIARMRLPELRRARHLSQSQLADDLDMNQGDVSKMERRTDMYVRTLARFIEAAGGKLRVVAEFPDGPPIEIMGFEDYNDGPSADETTTSSIREEENAGAHA